MSLSRLGASKLSLYVKAFHYKAKTLWTQIQILISKESAFWGIVGVIASICQVVSEYCLLNVLSLIVLGSTNSLPWQVPGISDALHRYPFWGGITVFLLCAILRHSFQFIALQSSAALKETINLRLKYMLLKRTIGVNQHEYIEASRLSFLFADVIPQASQFFNFAVLFSFTLFQSVIFFFLCFLSAPYQTSISIGFIGIVAIWILFVNKMTRMHSFEIPKHQRDIVKSCHRISKSWLYLRITRSRESEYLTLKKSIDRFSAESLRASFWGSLSTVSPGLLGALVLTLVIAISHHFFGSHKGTIFAFIFLFYRFIQTCGELTSRLSKIHSFYPRFELSVLEYQSAIKDLGSPPEIPSIGLSTCSLHSIDSEDYIQSRKHSRSLRLKVSNLNFSYNVNGHSIINNLSFDAETGQQIGISGNSGSGKSTLLKVLAGVLEPSSGRVIYMTNFGESVKPKFGYVGPNPYLVEGSIIDNLRYGLDSDINIPLAKKLLIEVGLPSFANDDMLFNKNLLSENEEGISSGQKQRISLVRALLSCPDVLVLDEASSNLDETSESQIISLLKSHRSDFIALIVSHRKAVLADADKMIFL